ncbi:MAG: NadS family protein [Gemmatimonadales bacterium]
MSRPMPDELFSELVTSVREGGAILRGHRAPSRSVSVTHGAIPDVRALRAHFKLSQPKFAALLGISVGTLRNWEQRRRAPEGPARVLLQIAARDPQTVLATVAPARRQAKPGRVRRARRKVVAH